MAGRKRIRLVPEGAVEVFEIRAVLYFVAETGEAIVATDVSGADGRSTDAPIHEILGVLRRAEGIIEDDFDERGEA